MQDSQDKKSRRRGSTIREYMFNHERHEKTQCGIAATKLNIQYPTRNIQQKKENLSKKQEYDR